GNARVSALGRPFQHRCGTAHDAGCFRHDVHARALRLGSASGLLGSYRRLLSLHRRDVLRRALGHQPAGERRRRRGMTKTAVVTAIPATDGRLLRANLDQWICWWSIPIFYNLFGLIFVYFTKIMPPPSPGLTQDEIVAFIRTNTTNLQIGFVLLV